MMHGTPHPRAGQSVNIKSNDPDINGSDLIVEDWWDRVGGQSWMIMGGNPACMNYAARSAANCLPVNDEVVYGKIGAFGHLIHVSEIETE